MGTPSSERIIQDVNLALKASEFVYHVNGTRSWEGLADRNRHEPKAVGEGGNFQLGSLHGPKGKGRGAIANSTKNMFSRSDQLKSRLKKKNTTKADFFPDATVFFTVIENSRCEVMR